MLPIHKSLSRNLTREQLVKIVSELSIDTSFGILTRNAFKTLIFPKIKEHIVSIIFADIDKLHIMNKLHGYQAIDQKLRTAFRTRSVDYIFRWFSGDEVVWVLLHGDAEQAIMRIKERLNEQNLQATFASVQVGRLASWSDFEEYVNNLAKDVLLRKAN